MLKKIFAPEIEALNHRLKTSDSEKIQLLAQIEDLKSDREFYRKMWLAEIKKREKITNEIIKTRQPKLNFEEVTNEKPPTPINNELSQEDIYALEFRAADYCSQKFGEDYAKSQFDEVLAKMKADPDEWLTN